MKKGTKNLVLEVEEVGVEPNLSLGERIISVAIGSYMIYNGIKGIFKRPISALTELGIGGAMVYRGGVGQCRVKEFIDQQ